MKKLIIINIIFLLTCVQFINAQKEKLTNLPNFDKRKIHFGYYLGVNNNSFKISYYDQSGIDLSSPVNPIPGIPPGDMLVEVDSKIGFNIGFVIDYRLHKNINLRFEPGLRSNTKELTFHNPNLDANDSQGNKYYNGTDELVREVSGTYLHLPFLLKFSTNRMNNLRPYVIGGVAFDYNFSSNENNPDDNYEVEFRMKSMNFMYEAGLGVDFYFNFFKFTPSIRGIWAMTNELVPDNDHHPPYSSPWTGPIDFLGTHILTASPEK